MSSLDIALIGNGGIGAIIDRQGEVVWACMPRFDSDPVFCSLLKPRRADDDWSHHRGDDDLDPRGANSGRNWDYRYCWLRDGYFVVNALNRMGTTRTMERYLRHIINLTAVQEDGHLQEGIDPITHELWGNFAQTYSMVGLVNSAVRLSKSREEAF